MPLPNPNRNIAVIGLCALLGASTIGVGLAIGLTLLLALICTSVLVVATRRLVTQLHAATVVLFFVGAVSALQLAIAATRPALAAGLGYSLPLLAAGGLLLPRTALFTKDASGREMLARVLQSGLVFLALATVLGGLREFLGSSQLVVQLPGALLCLGLIAALYQGCLHRLGVS